MKRWPCPVCDVIVQREEMKPDLYCGPACREIAAVRRVHSQPGQTYYAAHTAAQRAAHRMARKFRGLP